VRLAALLFSIAVVAAILAGATAGAGVRQTLPGDPTDPTRLPIGDGRVALSVPAQGYVFVCQMGPGGGGAMVEGPWIKSDGTFDLTAKAIVDGAVTWPGVVRISKHGGLLGIAGNGLPTAQTTGVFPVQPSDDAFQYDPNPNSISPQTIQYSLDAKPEKAPAPSCLSGGPIGIARNGVAIFNALDAENRDAVAHEVLDSCAGHPQQSGVYHYHSSSPCLDRGSKKKHSKLFGYIFDGFPIFGPRGKDGKLLTDADLDACHGHTHRVKLNGKTVRIYHYHATLEYPYTVGCYAGTALTGTGAP